MTLDLNDEIIKIEELYSKASKESEFEELARIVQECYEQYSSSESLAYWRLKILLGLVKNKEDKSELKNIIEEAKGVYENYPKSEKIGSWYLSILNEYIRQQEVKSELKSTIGEAKRIYEEFPDSENIIGWYLIILNGYLNKQEGKSELKSTAEEAKGAYEKYPESEEIGKWYLRVLRNYLKKQKVTPELKGKIEEAKEIYEKHPLSEDIATDYLIILNDYLTKLEVKSELKSTVEEAKGIYENHPKSEQIGSWYIRILNQHLRKQEDKAELKSTLEGIKGVYKEYQDSQKLGTIYLIVLSNYAFKRIDKSELESAVEEAKRIYQQYDKTEYIVRAYISIIYINALKKKEESIWNSSIEEARQLYKEYQYSKNIARWYLAFLLEETKKNLTLLLLKDTTKIISEILQVHPQLANIVEKHIDVLMAEATETCIENCTDLLMCFADHNSVKDYLMQTKYGILFDSNEISKEDLRNLVKIFSLVQEIKNQLIVKDPRELTFGHYTSAKVLQLLLKQKEEKEKYAIENRSRLSNVNYMNDPSEGKVLNQFLKLDTTSQKISLKARPWFLMSLTTEIDRLEMWAQYGKQAEGVCLVLDSSDFLKVNSYADTGWITAKRLVELPDTNSENNILEVASSENKLVHGDYIYRIGYLELSSGTAGLLTEQNNDELKDVIDDINQSLISLREKVKEIDKETILYEKVDECLEEIRYLFKSADYKYEKELRILKFVPLEADNKKIKIDESEEVAKLYIERDNPIQIAEVIFGPKFSKPENVTPLLQLLDKNIKFSQSKIPFK